MREKPDFYAEKAKKAGYLARSVYKLEEIQQKHSVLRSGDRVLDLGAAPGSWTQRSLEIIGPQGSVCAVDLTPLSLDSRSGAGRRTSGGGAGGNSGRDGGSGNTGVNAGRASGAAGLTSLTIDLFSDELESRLSPLGPFDVILSDAAPDTSGNRGLDAARSAALVERCLQLCETQLERGGNITVKLFQGSDEQALRAQMQRLFRKAATAKPKACRKDSFEIYLVGIGYRGGTAEASGAE